MRIFQLTKKKVIVLSIIISLFFISIMTSQSMGMQHYQTTDFVTGIVTATTLNVRQGPGTSYKTVTQVYKNEYIRVFAQIGEWYVIQTDKDYVGMVSKKYVRAIYPQTGNAGTSNTTTGNTSSSENNTGLTKDEQEVFELVNNQRIANGLKALLIDEEVQKVARIKAQDMVNSNYFSHTSPTYGTPFEMLKSFKISYKAAGENIAGNSSNSKAVTAWMNSEGHRANILSNNYNYCGVGVVQSDKYGKIYVQMFIGK